MNAREIAHRIFEVALEKSHAFGIGVARPTTFGNLESRPWIDVAPTHFDIDKYRRAADRVLAGEFSIFAMRSCALGFPPDWNRDPKSGIRAPLAFGRSVNYRDESVVGNIKYLWEPNRQLELVTLAQAWHLSGQRQYAEGCKLLVESWIEQCPYPRGVNWASGLELGIRLVNWSFAWHLLGAEQSPVFEGEEGDQFRRRWLTSIYQHCHYLARYPSLYSSANNHLLGEQLGLLVASLTWPKWEESARWAADASRTFQREALNQNSSDGVNLEQGIWYHHEVVDMMLIAALVAMPCGVTFEAAYWRRLEAMLEFVASIMDCGGHVPAFGDSDDAVIVRFCPDADFPVFCSQLASGAVLFGRGDFKAKARAFDDKSRWLLGDQAELTFDALPIGGPTHLPRREFPVGGYYVLGANFETPKEIRVVADAGPLGYLSIAAHGHADALSFTMSAAGEEMLIDPGTYSYHTDARWRRYFRGTSAHNTVVIDDQDQSVSGGNFMWTRHAQILQRQASLSGELQTLSASHDGYCRLPEAAVHSRTMEFREPEGILQIRDEIAGHGDHRFAIYFHLSERCRVSLQADCAEISKGGVEMTLRWPAGTVARVVRGQVDPPLGWASHQFDAKLPTCTLVIEGNAHGNWCGTSEIRVHIAAGDDRDP